MKRCRNILVLKVSIVLILCAASVAGARADTKHAQPYDAARSRAASNPDNQSSKVAEASDYVGTETCKSCHENMYNSYEKTPHWQTMNDTHGAMRRR
jgi:cytochrome c553